MEIRAYLRHSACTGTTGAFFSGVDLAAPIDIRASIHRVFEHVLQGHAIGTSPYQRPLGWPLTQTDTQFDIVMDEIAQQWMEGCEVSQLAKDQAHELLHLRVLIKANLALCRPDIADGKRKTQFSPTGFLEFALIHALFNQMQLRFTHRAF